MRQMILGATLIACAVATHAAAQTEPPRVPAVDVEREVERLIALGSKGTLWPGFDPLSIPLAVFDGQKTYLFRHPSPPADFKPFASVVPNTFVRDGRLEAITANSSAMIGGVLTATLLQNLQKPESTPWILAPIALHESFHVFQRMHHKSWSANEADLFVYHFEVPKLLSFRRLESDALRRALLNYDSAKSQCWVRTALKFRKDRFAEMDPSFAAYERGTELNEGLATYVEARSVDRIVELPAAEFGISEVRQRAYASGSALAALLDRFAPRWKESLESDDKQSLDALLDAAVGSGESCQFTAWEYESSSRRAHADADALSAQLAKRRTDFLSKKGWRIVIVGGSGSGLMFPQGFDPLNVFRVGAKVVLHTRFLKTGNGDGAAEVLNTEALSEGAGAHPLMQGISQVTITGLPKPTVTNTNGVVTVKAPGVSVQFKKATVKLGDRIVTIQLGSG